MVLDLPFLVRQFFREMVNTGGAVVYNNCIFMTVIAITVFYIVSPFDLIPESVFGIIGLLDDLGILSFAFVILAQGFREILRGRNDAQVRAR